MTDEKRTLPQLRSEFNHPVAYKDRWQGLNLFREWAKLTGQYPVVDAIDRFVRYMRGGPEDGAA